MVNFTKYLAQSCFFAIANCKFVLIFKYETNFYFLLCDGSVAEHFSNAETLRLGFGLWLLGSPPKKRLHGECGMLNIPSLRQTMSGKTFARVAELVDAQD